MSAILPCLQLIATGLGASPCLALNRICTHCACGHHRIAKPMNLIAACCAASCAGAKEIHEHYRNVAYLLTASFPSSACAAHTRTPGATRQNTEHTIDTKSAHRRIDRCECE